MKFSNLIKLLIEKKEAEQELDRVLVNADVFLLYKRILCKILTAHLLQRQSDVSGKVLMERDDRISYFC